MARSVPPIRTQWLAGLLFWLLLACVYGLLRPALAGFYIFDDVPNLGFLGQLSAATSWNEWLVQLLSSPASALGRPVAMLSFSWQYPSWPQFPADFIYVNILLHLLNGCLLLWLMLRLGETLATEGKRQIFLALTATALWLLHPIQISTVAYIVQRMAELATLFTLLALLAYLHGRRMAVSYAARGYAWMSAGMVVFGSLAVLSKENAALLPAFVLVLEATLLRAWRTPPGYATWRAAFLYLPLLLLAGYFALNAHAWQAGYAMREFSLPQRLLTEPAILLDYLGKILLPRPSAFSFYYDDYPIARGLLNPPYTLAATALLFLTIAGAILARRRYPVLSLAVLWFFTGHALESTFLPLELYFEHRNYLPLIGPCLALAYLALRAWDRAENLAMRRFLVVAGAAYLGLLAAVTSANASLWGNPMKQALVWRQAHPDSIRVAQRLADMWRRTHNFQEAARIHEEISSRYPDQIDSKLLLLELGCLDQAIPLPDHAALLAKARTVPHSYTTIVVIKRLVARLSNGQCARLQSGKLPELIETLTTNPNFQAHETTLANLYMLLGEALAWEGHLASAIAALDHIHEINPARPDVALMQADWLINARLYDDALRYVARAREMNSRYRFPRHQKYQLDSEFIEHKARRMKALEDSGKPS